MYSVRIVGSLSRPSEYVPVAVISNQVLYQAATKKSPTKAIATGLLELILPEPFLVFSSRHEQCCRAKHRHYRKNGGARYCICALFFSRR